MWQENVPLIVMLCNTVEGHRVRCQQYWPSFGSQSYGPFTIKLEREQVLADYFLRTFKITVSNHSFPLSMCFFEEVCMCACVCVCVGCDFGERICGFFSEKQNTGACLVILCMKFSTAIQSFSVVSFASNMWHRFKTQP